MTPSGGESCVVSWSVIAWLMRERQIGAAPVMPEAMRDMGVLSLFPTQTMARRWGV